eukprot:7693977-Prorocentrum_lima.AAC.1
MEAAIARRRTQRGKPCTGPNHSCQSGGSRVQSPKTKQQEHANDGHHCLAVNWRKQQEHANDLSLIHISEPTRLDVI